MNHVFTESKLKTKRQKQIFELIEEHPPVIQVLANMGDQEMKIAHLNHDLSLSMTANEKVSQSIAGVESGLQKTNRENAMLQSELEKVQKEIDNLETLLEQG